MENVRLVKGEGAMPDVLREVYEGLRTRQDVANSVLVVILAGALRFDTEPREIAADLALGTPDHEEWEEMLPELRRIVDA